jgi:two-component system, OmpR family, sensor kinase
MRRSLRFQVAARISTAMMAALAAMSLFGVYGARLFLDGELNASLLNVASIQAGAVTDAPGGEMVFHEWDLTPEEAAQVRELNRYAQVWSASGESLLRTQYITQDLPLDGDALARAAAGDLVMTEQRFQGMPIRSLYYPLERMGAAHARHVLQVAAPLTGRNHMLRQLTWLLLAITAISGAASFAGGWWLARRVVRPVHEIIDQAEAMGAGTLGRRIEADAQEQEYERLITVLNSMLARLEGSFEAQRRFIADASHELRSPLTALKGEMEVALRRERSHDEYRRVIRSGLQEVDRLTLLTQDLLTLARVDAGVMQPRLETTDLVDRARSVVRRLQPLAERNGVRLTVDAGDTAELVADPGLLDQLLWNLVENAVKFTPAGGTVTVAVTRRAGDVRIEVRDTGPGIAEADLDRIFERFYRADQARTASPGQGGTGLGLSIVRGIAEVHGGKVRVANLPGGGAVFEVSLPGHAQRPRGAALSGTRAAALHAPRPPAAQG